MDIVIFKDGTIPIGVGKMIATDVGGDDELVERLTHESGSDMHDFVELFVVDDYPYLLVMWHEDDGFTAVTTGNLAQAFAWLNEDVSDEEIATSNMDGKHWAVTVNPGDHEYYRHLFMLDGAA
jgi:hypothetical protein